MAKVLLENGGDVNYENNSGRNAFMAACLAGKCFNIWNVLGSPLVLDIAFVYLLQTFLL